MDAILESLYARKSVRAYTDEPVSEDIRQQLLDCAVQAPSAGCQQLLPDVLRHRLIGIGPD